LADLFKNQELLGHFMRNKQPKSRYQ